MRNATFMYVLYTVIRLLIALLVNNLLLHDLCYAETAFFSYQFNTGTLPLILVVYFVRGPGHVTNFKILHALKYLWNG